MSRSRNTTRLAKKIRDQSSLKLPTASRLAQQANVYLGSSIKDSSNPHQRRLEAHMPMCWLATSRIVSSMALFLVCERQSQKDRA